MAPADGAARRGADPAGPPPQAPRGPGRGAAQAGGGSRVPGADGAGRERGAVEEGDAVVEGVEGVGGWWAGVSEANTTSH